MRLSQIVAFWLVLCVVALVGAQDKWDRDHPTGGYGCPGFNIIVDQPTCSPNSFAFVVRYWGSHDDLLIQSGGINTYEYNHTIHLCNGNYSFYLQNKDGADPACAPQNLTLTTEKGAPFFQMDDGSRTFHQYLEIVFHIGEEKGCFWTSQYSIDQPLTNITFNKGVSDDVTCTAVFPHPGTSTSGTNFWKTTGGILLICLFVLLFLLLLAFLIYRCCFAKKGETAKNAGEKKPLVKKTESSSAYGGADVEKGDSRPSDASRPSDPRLSNTNTAFRSHWTWSQRQ
jgi:hypothetical protein